MAKKGKYEAVNIEIILYSNNDVVRTSNVDSEVGGAWDSAGWGE